MKINHRLPVLVHVCRLPCCDISLLQICDSFRQNTSASPVGIIPPMICTHIAFIYEYHIQQFTVPLNNIYFF